MNNDEMTLKTDRKLGMMTILKRNVKYIKPEIWRFVLSFIMMIFNVLVGLLLPRIVGNITTELSGSANEIEFSYANSNKQAVKLRNVAGELSATMTAMSEAIKMGYKELIIYHDYTGIRCWITQEWRCKNDITQAYRNFYERQIKDDLDVHFVWVKGHSGDEYNERVDKLARKSLEL